MENAIPYLMCAVAFFLHKDKTNQAVTGLFAVFYSLSLVFNTFMIEEVLIFEINLVLTALFYLFLAQFSKITMMMIIFCVTDVILTLIDVGALLAYNYNWTSLYATLYELDKPFIIMQYAALWVTDGERINVGRFYGNIRLHIRNFTMRLLYR
jgi:hypothetical protein